MSHTPLEHMLPVPLGEHCNPLINIAIEIAVQAAMQHRGLEPQVDLEAVRLYVSLDKVFVELNVNVFNPTDQGEPSQATHSSDPSTDPAGEPSAPSKPAQPVNPSTTAGLRRAPRSPAFPISKQ